MRRRAIPRKRLAVNRQQLLILLVAAVMAGSFCLLVLRPRQEELSVLGSAVARERHMVNQKVMTSQEGMYLTARIAGLRKARNGLAACLPAEPAMAEFLQAMAEQVATEPLVTREVERADMRPDGEANAVPLRLRLTGPFEAVHRCLARIEGLDRLSRFRSLCLSRLGTDGCVRAEAEMLVYYLPADVAPPAAARPDGGRAGPEKVQG
jgi:Tfp pilus assembly protein PilO